MRVTALTDTARDFYTHLPTLTAWISDAPTTEECERRIITAGSAILSLPDSDQGYADCRIRVGYDPLSDEPFFIRKVDGGYIHIACEVDLRFRDPAQILPK